MRRRSLRVFIILTLLASFLSISGLSVATRTAVAAPPPGEQGNNSGGTKAPHASKGVAPHEARQAGIAAPNGQTAYGWGDNSDLVLCNGQFSGDEVYGPTPNIYLSGVTAVAAGEYHALYLLSDGTVYACGNDADGAMGIGSAADYDYGTPQQVLGVCPSASPSPTPSPTPSPSGSPAPVPAPSHSAGQCGYLSGIKAISAGYLHSLALATDGTVYSWGINNYGELGIGNATGPEICPDSEGGSNTPCSTTPVRVPGLTNVVQVVAGGDMGYALKGDGTVWAWGYNSDGELGQGSNVGPETCLSDTCSTTPLQVPGLTGVTQIASGMDTYHALALKADGTVWAWGYNHVGQIGNGVVSTTGCECVPTPTQVIGPGGGGVLTGVLQPDPAHPSFERIAVSYTNSYAVTGDGTVYAWGENNYGQLGIDTEDGQPDAVGTSCDCYTYPVHVLGPDGTGNLGDIVSLGGGGNYSAFAITAAGRLYAWGYNEYHDLGLGSDDDDPRSLPTLVSGLKNVVAVTASDYDFTLAIVAAPSPQFTVTASKTGNGTISNEGITSYTSGDAASYTATAAAGQTFVGWTLDGVYVGYASPLTLTVAGNRTLVAAFVATPTFGDLGALSAEERQAITFLAALGIVNPAGVNGSGNFQPGTDVKRAEVAAFVARVFGWQKEFHANTFPDKCDPDGGGCVDDELWNNVAALKDYGIVGGYTDPQTCQGAGTTAPCYLPRDVVQRVQVVSVVARAFIKQPDLRPTGFWDRLPADPAQYANVPDAGTQRSDLTTYRANVGAVPGQTSDANFNDPNGNGSRLYMVRVLYAAFNAQFGVDNVP